MLKRNKIWVIMTGILVILPVIVGVILWSRLPEQMAVQFSAADGSVAGYRPKEFVVFCIPLLICFLHIVAAVFVANDPKRQSMGDLMYRLLLFICPVISWFFAAFTYMDALEVSVPLLTLVQVFAGLFVVLFGVLLPKCPQNPSIGFRFAATLNDEEVWKDTHLLAGIVWIIAGLILLFNAFTGIILSQFLILLVALMIGIPYFYASRSYKNRHKEDRYERMREELKKKALNQNKNHTKKKRRK